jgi:hypothetical protein
MSEAICGNRPRISLRSSGLRQGRCAVFIPRSRSAVVDADAGSYGGP